MTCDVLERKFYISDGGNTGAKQNKRERMGAGAGEDGWRKWRRGARRSRDEEGVGSGGECAGAM